ncbi:MAG: DUF6178 family protein [Desulfomonilaceae bacterium]
MDTLGLVVHDEQTFLNKVVNSGMERGIFTRDRADEIIRISVAMANKYVLQKGVDFRSTEELVRVQETILKLIGVGLEIRSKGEIETGIDLLMEASPVDLFRLAYTRVEKLRHTWSLLLRDHRIEILVSPGEYKCLADITCQQLSEMSIFTESELHAIRSLTLDDELFATVGLVEYYEAELERYQFLLRLKEILPFKLLNRSASVRAENLAEVDSMRSALISTLIISYYAESDDPVAVTMRDVRYFLAALDPNKETDLFPEELENAVLEVIHELGEGLDEREASLLTREIVGTAHNLLETVIHEWDTANSQSESVFFKRWSCLVILADAPDPINRLLSSDEILDEFDFEMLLNQLLSLPEKDAFKLIEKLPWERMTPEQIIRMFHQAHSFQEAFAKNIFLTGFSAVELLELVEAVNHEVFEDLTSALEKFLGETTFTLEDLEILATLPHSEAATLLRMAAPPAECDAKRALEEFRDASDKVRQILFHSCMRADFFPQIFELAWSIDPNFVKREVKTIPAARIGQFLLAAADGHTPKVESKKGSGEEKLQFASKDLNSLFRSLPMTKKKAAMKFFTQEP